MKTWLVNFRSEWLKLIRNPQIIWLMLIGSWTIIGWAWLIGQNGAVITRGHITYDLTKRLFPFMLLTRLVSLPIFSLIFFITLNTERQNQTNFWLYRLPIKLLQWHLVKLLTASFLCELTIVLALILASGIIYWYISDLAIEPIPFFIAFWFTAKHLLLLPIVIWLTLYGLSFFIRSPIVAVLILLILQVVGGLVSDYPNPFSSLRLVLAYSSSARLLSYQSDRIGTQYIIAGTYCAFLLLIGWLVGRKKPTWMIHVLP